MSNTYEPNGSRETARRARQIASGVLKTENGLRTAPAKKKRAPRKPAAKKSAVPEQLAA